MTRRLSAFAAPLETFVGNTAADGIAGALSVDPERRQRATGSLKVDMNLVWTGIENFLDTEVTVKQRPDTDSTFARQ